jgi:hypothetical protein
MTFNVLVISGIFPENALPWRSRDLGDGYDLSAVCPLVIVDYFFVLQDSVVTEVTRVRGSA